MPETEQQILNVEQVEAQQEKISFLKWGFVFFLILAAALVTWVWNLNPDQKNIYLRYFEPENSSRHIENVDQNAEYQAQQSLPIAIQDQATTLPETSFDEDNTANAYENLSEPPSVATLETQATDDNSHMDSSHMQNPDTHIAVQPSTINVHLQNLLLEIHELRQDLRQSQQDQVMLHQANLARQKMDLHTRLRWLLMPSNNWMHLHMYWQDIASLPMLTHEQREKATEQAEQSRKHMQHILAWREQMSLIMHDIQSMHQMSEQSLIPKDGSPWLAWLSGHFSLSHAQPQNDEALVHLQNLIQEMLLLGHGQWPDEQRWSDIYRQIVLHFPEKIHVSALNFNTPAQDKQAMKALAVSWLGQQ